MPLTRNMQGCTRSDGGSLTGVPRVKDRKLSGLHSADRAGHYREFANEAMQKAELASDPLQHAQYLSIASKWHALAVDAEHIGGGPPSQIGK